MKPVRLLSAQGSIRYGLVPVAFIAAVVALAATGDDQAQPQPPAQPGPKAKPPVLTSRPLPKKPLVTPLEVGEALQTKAGERCLRMLPDGTMVYVNEKTEIKLTEAGSLKVNAGDIYVEQPPAGTKKSGPLAVRTPSRDITAQNSSFKVGVTGFGPGVIVMRGQVLAAGNKKPITAGQWLPPDKEPQTAPHSFKGLDWTRELMVAAEPALAPASDYTGGALVAIDPDGQETKLTLRKFHIDVVIEDGFARTTIDQTYFNHENTNLEGTFFFPLPPDASLSQLAMYVDGKLMEGGMVERGQGAEIYDTIKYMKRDPALLEWVDGSTFKMRVFPIEPRKEKRLLLSYTQKLASVHGQSEYRFPAGHSLPMVKDWSVLVRIKGADGAVNATTPAQTFKQITDKGGDLILTAKATNALFHKDVVIDLDNTALREDAAAKGYFAMAEHEGQKYFMAALRPDLLKADKQSTPTAGPRHWLFLFESSGDRDPLLARVQIEVMRHLLLKASSSDTFNVLAANTKVRPLAKESLPVTAETIADAVAFLESSHLIGAFDMGQVIAALGKYNGNQPNSFVVHLGTGIPAMGDRRLDVMSKSFPKGMQYVGVGVGKRWNRSFMKSAAEHTGGYFTQINPDESIAWRAFELASTLSELGPANLRQVSISQVTPSPDAEVRFLYFNQLLTQGEEFCALTRLDGDAAWPKTVTLRYANDQAVEVPVKLVKQNAGYLPRMWAKLEIDRLLTQTPFEKKHKDQVIALSKAMYVMSPFTSLLVLENEDMYKQYGVDKGRKDHWAMYPAPETIDVVFEPDPNSPVQGNDAKSPKAVLQTIAGFGKAPPMLEKQQATLGLDWNTDEKKLDPGQQQFYADMFERAGKPGQGAAGPGNWNENITMGTGFGFQTLKAATGEKLIADQKFVQAATKNLELAKLADLESSKSPSKKVAKSAFKGSDAQMDALSRLEPSMPKLPEGGDVLLGGLKKESMALDKTVFRASLDGKLIDSSPNSTNPFLYKRPSYTNNEAIFSNLLAYAPGLNTSAADVLGVLEKEAYFARPLKEGNIDAGARKLIDKAREAAWKKVTVPGQNGQPDLVITFNGQGHFVYQTVLPPGLTEQVVYNGKTMLHVYPQLGLAAQRTANRFHRAGTSSLLPWVVASTSDLARGADLKLLEAGVVDILPHHEKIKPAKDKDGKDIEPTLYHLRLVFGENGGLAERHVIEMPKNKIVLRQVCAADGSVRWLDAKDKELSAIKATLNPAQQPSLTAQTKGLIVLDLPYRTPDHVRKTLGIEKKNNAELTFAQATTLLAAFVANGQGNEARNLFQTALQNRNEKQLGYYVLLAAAGQDLGGQGLNVVDDHPDAPLAQYLALHTSPVLRQHATQWAIGSVQWQDPLLKHLATSHALFQRWQGKQSAKWTPERLKKERALALQYVRDHKDSAFGWVMLTLLQDRANQESNEAGKSDEAYFGELAKHWELFEKSGLDYAARYEQARCLSEAGQEAKARGVYLKLYADTLKEGLLPPLDGEFRSELLEGKGKESWTKLMQSTAEKLIADKKRPAVLALAWQCWQLSDEPQANELIGIALEGIKDDKERHGMMLAAVLFYRQTKQLPQADQLLTKLLEDPKQAERPELWRLASSIAGERKSTARSITCLEKALDLEFKDLPDILNLKTVRKDYGKLLDHYQSLAESLVALKMAPPDGFLAKVIKTADRWRALDPQSEQACHTTAAILRTLGQNDLGWDYLTTPIAMQPNEPSRWLGLAGNLKLSGETTLADLAYKAAYDAEPNNAQTLWDRAENLQQAGKTTQAQALYRQIAEGHWAPHYSGLVAQAKQRLK